jgi:hypothetical protein
MIVDRKKAEVMRENSNTPRQNMYVRYSLQYVYG